MGDRIEGQLVNSAQNMGLASMPDYIDHYVGAGPHLIENPDPENMKYVIVDVESGSFRMQVGDTTGSIGAYAVPASDVTDGSGTFSLEEFEKYVFTAPNEFTVVGNGGGAVITVSWL